MCGYNPKEYREDRNTNQLENCVTMFFAGSMPTLTVILTPNFYWSWSSPQTGWSNMRDKPDKILCIPAIQQTRDVQPMLGQCCRC